MAHASKQTSKTKAVSLNEEEIGIAEIVAVARNRASVEPFQGPKRNHAEAVRKYVEQHWLSDSSPALYGFNTGIGSLKNVKIPQGQIQEFQRYYVKSHCVGVGEPLDIEIVRAAMLIQANALSKGYSGVRPLIVDKLIEMLNKGIHPVVPEQGSLGASGDLAPMTHITSVLVGEEEAEVWIAGERCRIAQIKDSNNFLQVRRKGEEVTFQPIQLHGKEAVSLTNSTAVMLAISVLLLHDAEILLKNADIAAALSLEAMMCEKDAFVQELHALRGQKGQMLTAHNIRRLIEGSQRMTPEARHAYFNEWISSLLNRNLKASSDKEAVKKYKMEFEFDRNRIQDAYSLRCVPQVHGACKDTFHHVKTIVTREISAVTDNPVIFPRRGEASDYDVRSGGNFHGEPLALVLDFLAIALAEIGSISERRTFRLLSPHMSFGLPQNLTGGEAGMNSGYMLLQYTGAQLVSENKILAHPASVDSVPTSDNQEDHVSMGMTAARKARKILHNVQNLLAIEFLCAVQGIHLSSQNEAVSLPKFSLGRETSKAFDFITCFQVKKDGAAVFPFQKMHGDEYANTKIRMMNELSRSGKIVDAIGTDCVLVEPS
ncbi:MAG: histidine ammonia-lyase [bacterium]